MKIPREYYDNVAKRWGYHYTEHNKWFALMLLVVSKIRSRGTIIDLGCGAGHLAELLHDSGYGSYVGIDFSPHMLERCVRRDLPSGFQWIQADLETIRWIDNVPDHDTVVSTEFFEHVENDLQILGQAKPGTHIIFSTTNEPADVHTRWFKDETEILNRYGYLFSKVEIFGWKNGWVNRLGWQKFFIVDGVRGDS